MKILFIGEYYYFENLPIMILAGFLKKNGYRCEYIDLKFERDYIAKVKNIQPDIIAYSTVSGTEKKFLEVNRKLKSEIQFFSLFGGPHCTLNPEIISEEGVDAVCVGEGEEPLLELVQKLEQKLNIHNIQNLWIKDNENIYKNDIRELVTSLDNVLFPDRSLFDKYQQYKNIRSRVVITSRGCPFNCSYCYNNIIKQKYLGKGKYVRIRSVENLISELTEIKQKYKPRRIKFLDDTFILSKKWGIEFCKQYVKDIKIPFIACIRSDFMDEELIKELKLAGCIAVNFGIECGSEEYRNNILKRNLTNEQLKEVSTLFLKYKIKVISLNMLSLPGETISDCIETLRFNIECNVSYAHAFTFSPLPNTELSNYAIKHNFFNGNYDFVDFNFMYTKSVLNMKDKKKMKRLQYLFSTIVAFPFLLSFVNVLIKLPFNMLYQSIFFIHRVYNHLFISKQIDWEDIFMVDYYFKKRSK